MKCHQQDGDRSSLSYLDSIRITRVEDTVDWGMSALAIHERSGGLRREKVSLGIANRANLTSSGREV